MIPTRRLAAAVCGALLVSTTAFAADVVLALDGVEGDPSAGPRTIEVQSWSWGATNSNAGSAPTTNGKVNVQDLSMTKAAPRDSASGLATGRRTAAVADASTSVSAAAVAATAAPEIRDVSVTVPEASAKSACATGKHIKSATITARGERVELEDVVVTACTTSAGVSTLAMRGHQKTGHVTLMK